MMTEDPRYNQNKLTDQDPFRDKDVLVGGGGAVGSYLTDSVAKMGAGHLTVIDYDRYEIDNASKTSRRS